MSVPVSSKCGGLLLAAFRAGETEEITWVDIKLGDLVITVAQDAMKTSVNDRAGVRLPVSYAEAAIICAELGCVSPTQPMCDAIFAQARPQLNFVPLVRTAADSAKMATVGFALRFHDGVEKQLAASPPCEGAALFGAWKLWILHKRIAERGAVNYGFWDKSKKPPRPIQTVGGQHNAAHYDYSQLLQPVQRMARKASTGEEVDLLDYIAARDRVPAKYLARYALDPDAPVSSLHLQEGELARLKVLTGAGIDIAPVDGWEKRGREGFTPEGILVHHTARPKKSATPLLQTCIDGQPDRAGPLCHIVLGRKGKAHLLAANMASHAGKGAQEVLDLVLKDEAVAGDAKENKYEDAALGDPFFYGIEVEVESGRRAGEPYSNEQLAALVDICAALCQANGWSANRVVSYRQWTARGDAMTYKADLADLVAQRMDAGSIHSGAAASPEGARRVKHPKPKKAARHKKAADNKKAAKHRPPRQG